MSAQRTGIVGSFRRLASMPPGQARRIVAYLRPDALPGAAALACALGQAAVGLLPALVLRSLINYLQHRPGSFAHVGLLIGLGFAAVVVSGLLGVAETFLTLRISKGVVAGLRGEVFDKLLGQSVAYHTRSRGGELMSTVLNDVGGIDAMVGSTMLTLVSSICTVSVSFVLMVVLSPVLSVLTLFLFPLVAVILKLAGGSIYHRRLAVQEQFSTITSQLQERLGPSGIMLIKSFGMEGHERSSFASANDELRRLEIRSGMAGRWLGMVFSFLQLLGPVVLLLVGAYLEVHGDLSLGTLVAFAVVASAGFGAGFQQFANGFTSVLTSLPLWARIFAVLDAAPDITERPGAVDLAHPSGAITLTDVTLSYAGQNVPALRDVSVEIAPGQLVALVGRSGAGKTSLGALVARFYDPSAGSVMLDGHDLRDLTLRSLSNAVGLVLQDTYLFHASIRENLLYARPDATDEALRLAVHHAVLDDVIDALPDGYDTLVGERGYRLSGGERQRMAIARVMLKDPAVLILDEATSHLDSLSESLIQTAMTELFRGRTSLVIAHRLSTVRSADVILVLDGGRVVERGTNDDLRRSGGLYTHLYRTQFQPAG